MIEIPTTWLTQDAFDRLQQELDDRSNAVRADITKKIEAARDEGDLKENGGYHAAKEEQGKNEARIRQVRQIIENCEIGTPPGAKEGTATHGTVVTVAFDDGDEETFLLGSREEVATADIEVYSPTSPLGAAVLDGEVGDEVTYSLPNGNSLSVKISKVEPYLP